MTRVNAIAFAVAVALFPAAALAALQIAVPGGGYVNGGGIQYAVPGGVYLNDQAGGGGGGSNPKPGGALLFGIQ